MSFLGRIGELSLFLESVLIGCQVVVHGPDGLSFATQAMRLLMFCARYIDLYWPSQTTSPVVLFMKLFLIRSTLVVVVLLGYKKYSQGAHKSISYGTIGEVITILLFSATLGATFAHSPTVLEFFWAFSRFIDVVVEVPQLKMIFVSDKFNKWTIAYYCCAGSHVFFYTLNLIYSTQSYGIVIITPYTTILKGVTIAIFFMAHFFNQRWGSPVKGREKSPLDSDAPVYQEVNEKFPTIVVTPAV